MKIGIDIGAQTIKIGTKDKKGDYKIKTGIKTGPDFIKTGEKLKGEIEKSFGRASLAVIGCFGPLDLFKKKVIKAPNLPGWVGISFRGWEKILGCPIILENDANLAIYGEAKVGAGKGYKIVSGFTLGSGVGYGCVMDGKIYHGNWDVEAGHMILDPGGPPCGCGQKGCLEAYISRLAILEKFGKEPHDLQDEKAWDWIAHKIAWGCQLVTVLVKPDTIVLCGGIAQHKGLLEKVQKCYRKMLRIYPKEASETKIVLGKYIEHAGVIGAVELLVSS
ncbi:MAG: ROK family protein [Candidatus Berkelbacteria bacterium]|nr:ROK family protein [Candidatus Berkelbacteria bacterium]